ncbi:Aminopeptidase 2 mitochondrial [Apophysomyces sp. BC1034]|nr:Aminopeptidase 2 mitochondrial [Apophysomyces sp. BC1015]KAG0171279.1 Aminopeptidase 2 mitochondrial [Apophysomyces sp. BC1021]KAG0184821.1 Aminopeptidase 2 mitochondrial [Apophysomyces sp. BC1034]
MCKPSAQVPERQVLPTNVRPVHYDLSLKPNLETFVFYGRVKVDLEVNQDSNTIILNTHDIKIHSATLTSASLKTESKQAATDITYDEKKDLATLTFAESVPANSKAVLDIYFEGILNDQMAGFYRSSYKDAEGNTQHLATTQFEATDARRAFPCWDEPALKATFDVTLVVPAELTALSNMDVISEKPYLEVGKGTEIGKHTEAQTGKDVAENKNLKEVKYATTPRMSTYLLAFVVGPFEYIEAFTTGEHNGQPIRARVYALPGSVEQGRHALNVSTAAIEYFAKVFGEPYPLPKIDMVAIPDFEAGAMENWGLVTYRTVALLFDEKSSSIAFKKSTAYTVCHELAHQWFGNLVTMEWWDHLWLNEGFATWVGWLAVDHIFPDWDVWTSFVNEDMPRALNLDALRSSHPIEVAVNDPAEIHQIFDAISYYKGASVIRMLSSWLGVDTFLAGVRRYLHRHKLGNASTNDLWVALSEEAGVDVSNFMTLWTKRVGYPVLAVKEDAPGSINVTQSRYLSTGDLADEEDSTVWWVPLGVLVPEKVESYTLTEKTQTFSVPSDGLFKLNAGQTAVYRVNYPIEVIRRLAEEVKKGKEGLLADTADRVGLIADAGNLSVSGEQSTVAFLELAEAFVNETEYFCWSQISTHFSNILDAFYEQPQEIRDGLKALRRHLFAPIAHKLGWEFAATDDYLTNILRVLALSNAGRSNDAQTVTQAKERFWQFVQGNTDAVHPNLRGPVFSIALESAENEEEETRVWEEILKIYRDESLPTDQRLIALSSLGTTKSEALTKRYLNMSLDDKEVRGQDSIYVFRSLATNPRARDLFWEFFSQNYDILHAKFSKSLSLFGSAVRSAVGGFASLEKIREVEGFFADKDTKEYARPLQQALEGAKVSAKWVNRDHSIVADWVQENARRFA